MAEIAVGSVIDKLFQLVTEEAKLLRGIHGEVDELKYELESIQSFLKDADARAATELGDVKIWGKQLRVEAFAIEDAIDEYLRHVARRPHHRRGFIGFLHKMGRLIKHLKPRHDIASEIQEIKASVQKIKGRSAIYGFSNIGARNDPRMAPLYLEEAEVVGIEAPRNYLIRLLVEGRSDRTVISVVGMGGLGKTTLAKKVYDHPNVRNHFDCHAWIPVSQSYKTNDLLKSMIEQFCKSRKESSPEGMDAMNDSELIDKAREYLPDKRYVVVFDDVWEERFWREIEHALPDTKKGCRIMITTRNMNVANFCKTSSSGFIHELQPLTPNNAWELFCRKVSQLNFDDRNCPSDLKKLSHAIVERCQGLPLAIVAVGALLSTKAKNVYEWQKLYDNLSSELGNSGVREILSLSYYDLPYYLKSCFLYFGMYPEDYSINCVRLIRQWIAEGFVKETKGKKLEDVAQEYLTELIHRSLVQVSKVNFDGKARTCQLHDLLRETVLQKIEDLNFSQPFPKEQSSFNGLTRRLSINVCPYEALTRFENSHIRSILFFLDVLPKSCMNTIVAKFKLLKVLDFENAPLNHVPKDLGNLFHLRYLSLRNTMVKLLPKSIGNLQNLETLDLKQSLVCEIPVEIIKLKKLRYLAACYRDYSGEFNLTWGKGMKIHEGIGSLEALQKLYYVDADHGGIDLIEELKRLKQLRKLGIKNLKKETGKALCAAIEQMNQLESLNIRSISEDEIIDFQSISSPPQYLQRLSIEGRLEKLPDWISKLQNLVRLGLCWSRLSDDPLKTLQNLPNLLDLRISCQAYDGLQMHFEEGGFPKLKELVIAHMNILESIIIDNRALPFLEVLEFGPFPQLKEVPSEIQHLRNLKSLSFNDMPREFEESLDPDKGPYYRFIQHVPAVYIINRVSPRYGDFKIRTLCPSISKDFGFFCTWSCLTMYIKEFSMGIHPNAKANLKELEDQGLIRGFFESARDLLKEDGEIHITHKIAYPCSRLEVKKLTEEAAGLCLLE